MLLQQNGLGRYGPPQNTYLQVLPDTGSPRNDTDLPAPRGLKVAVERMCVITKKCRTVNLIGCNFMRLGIFCNM